MDAKGVVEMDNKGSAGAQLAYEPDVLQLAAKNGIPEADLPMIINGCSGGFSWAYRLMFGRAPSCEKCCDLHDLHYQLGGEAAERKAADRELLECARYAGKFPPGLISICRKAWRSLRAWVMYFAVRFCGGSKRYWAGK